VLASSFPSGGRQGREVAPRGGGVRVVSAVQMLGIGGNRANLEHGMLSGMLVLSLAKLTKGIVGTDLALETCT